MHEWVEFSSNAVYSLWKELSTILLGFFLVPFNFCVNLVTLLLNVSESKQYLKFMGQGRYRAVGSHHGTIPRAHDKQKWEGNLLHVTSKSPPRPLTVVLEVILPMPPCDSCISLLRSGEEKCITSRVQFWFEILDPRRSFRL